MYLLHVPGDECGKQDQGTSTCSENNNFNNFTIPLGPHSSKVISRQTEPMNVENNHTSSTHSRQPCDATVNDKSSSCLIDKAATPDNIMYERNDTNTPGLTFSIPSGMDRMFEVVSLNSNYQEHKEKRKRIKN